MKSKMYKLMVLGGVVLATSLGIMACNNSDVQQNNRHIKVSSEEFEVLTKSNLKLDGFDYDTYRIKNKDGMEFIVINRHNKFGITQIIK